MRGKFSKTEREPERKWEKSAKLLVLPRPSGEFMEWRRLQQNRHHSSFSFPFLDLSDPSFIYRGGIAELRHAPAALHHWKLSLLNTKLRMCGLPLATNLNVPHSSLHTSTFHHCTQKQHVSKEPHSRTQIAAGRSPCSRPSSFLILVYCKRESFSPILLFFSAVYFEEV